MRLSRAILAVSLVATITSCGPTSDRTTGADVAAMLQQGADAASRHDYTTCIDRYGKAAAARPDLVSAYTGRAKCYAAVLDLREGIADYSTAIRLSPRDPALHLGRAELERQTGNYSSAFDDCEFVASFAGVSPEQLDTAARILSDIGFLVDALKAADDGVKRFPEYWPLHLVRAQIKRQLSDFADALNEFNLAVNLARSDRLLPLEERGIFYLQRTLWKQARTDFSDAIRLAPEQPDLYANRAQAEIGLGDPQAALSDLNHGIDLLAGSHDTRLPPILVQRARLFLSQGDKSRARADLEQALSILPATADDLRRQIRDLLAAT